jgi:CDP-paratose 2-epimerase
MREAITFCEPMTGKKTNVNYSEQNRVGDHIWYISDTRKFHGHYPAWTYTYDLQRILGEIYESMATRV